MMVTGHRSDDLNLPLMVRNIIQELELMLILQVQQYEGMAQLNQPMMQLVLLLPHVACHDDEQLLMVRA
jgi:hypothetical protein